jgi:hypothetical protein
MSHRQKVDVRAQTDPFPQQPWRYAWLLFLLGSYSGVSKFIIQIQTDDFVRQRQQSLVFFFFLCPSSCHFLDWNLSAIVRGFYRDKLWQQNQILREFSVLFTNGTDDINDNDSDSNASDSDYVVYRSESDDRSIDERERNFYSFDYEWLHKICCIYAYTRRNLF